MGDMAGDMMSPYNHWKYLKDDMGDMNDAISVVSI
jgi:hypothetical protein